MTQTPSCVKVEVQARIGRGVVRQAGVYPNGMTTLSADDVRPSTIGATFISEARAVAIESIVMQRSSLDRDFSAYNAAQAERPVRPLARRAVELAFDVSRTSHARTAIELGSGIGIEARFMAENGFTVHTYDTDASVEAAMAAMSARLPIVHTTVDLAKQLALPDADLVLACATLPFVPRAAFDRLWTTVRASLRPRGILAIDLFGDRDDWAAIDGTFLTRPEVETMLDGLEIIELAEEQRDGRSLSGPKHWHTYRVIARRA